MWVCVKGNVIIFQFITYESVDVIKQFSMPANRPSERQGERIHAFSLNIRGTLLEAGQNISFFVAFFLVERQSKVCLCSSASIPVCLCVCVSVCLCLCVSVCVCVCVCVGTCARVYVDAGVEIEVFYLS